MDTSLNIVEMCAGYGGIGLGLRSVLGDRLRTIAYAEIETFAIELLLARMEGGQLDAAPIWTDLKTFPYREFHGIVDILVAGYPCQPFSAAGKRAGKDDPRHLWPWIADGIRLLRPRLCFFENVEGHISLGLSSVISDLEELGYKVSWGIFSASVDAGAPHQRKRVFILAYDFGQRIEELGWQITDAAKQHSAGDDGGNVLAHPGSKRRQQNPGSSSGDEEAHGREGWNEQQPHGHHLTKCHGQGNVWPSRPGELVNAEHDGHAPAENTGGDTASADTRRTQESQKHGQSARGCCQVWPSRPGEPQHGWEPPRVVGNTKHNGSPIGQNPRGGDAPSNRSKEGEECPSELEGTSRSCDLRDLSESEGVVGNTDHGRQSSGINAGSGSEAVGRGQGDFEQADGSLGDAAEQRLEGGEQPSTSWTATNTTAAAGRRRETQPPLGRDAHGPASGLGYAELCISCDNRTDELRLLGNGVVPATAARAFLTLIEELNQSNFHDPAGGGWCS